MIPDNLGPYLATVMLQVIAYGALFFCCGFVFGLGFSLAKRMSNGSTDKRG